MRRNRRRAPRRRQEADAQAVEHTGCPCWNRQPVPSVTRRGAAASTQEHEASTAKWRPVSRRCCPCCLSRAWRRPHPPNLRPFSRARSLPVRGLPSGCASAHPCGEGPGVAGSSRCRRAGDAAPRWTAGRERGRSGAGDAAPRAGTMHLGRVRGQIDSQADEPGTAGVKSARPSGRTCPQVHATIVARMGELGVRSDDEKLIVPAEKSFQWRFSLHMSICGTAKRYVACSCQADR